MEAPTLTPEASAATATAPAARTVSGAFGGAVAIKAAERDALGTKCGEETEPPTTSTLSSGLAEAHRVNPAPTAVPRDAATTTATTASPPSANEAQRPAAAEAAAARSTRRKRGIGRKRNKKAEALPPAPVGAAAAAAASLEQGEKARKTSSPALAASGGGGGAQMRALQKQHMQTAEQSRVLLDRIAAALEESESAAACVARIRAILAARQMGGAAGGAGGGGGRRGRKPGARPPPGGAAATAGGNPQAHPIPGGANVARLPPALREAAAAMRRFGVATAASRGQRVEMPGNFFPASGAGDRCAATRPASPAAVHAMLIAGMASPREAGTFHRGRGLARTLRHRPGAARFGPRRNALPAEAADRFAPSPPPGQTASPAVAASNHPMAIKLRSDLRAADTDAALLPLIDAAKSHGMTDLVALARRKLQKLTTPAPPATAAAPESVAAS